jgi:hypothetical protein
VHRSSVGAVPIKARIDGTWHRDGVEAIAQESVDRGDDGLGVTDDGIVVDLEQAEIGSSFKPDGESCEIGAEHPRHFLVIVSEWLSQSLQHRPLWCEHLVEISVHEQYAIIDLPSDHFSQLIPPTEAVPLKFISKFRAVRIVAGNTGGDLNHSALGI